MMQKIATFLLLIGFAGMAVFGLFVMDFAMGHGEVGCIASSMNGSEAYCPMGMLELAFHHISAFQAFSFFTVSGLFSLVFLFVTALITQAIIRILLFHPLLYMRRSTFREYSVVQYNKVIRWLSLFEHSPSII